MRGRTGRARGVAPSFDDQLQNERRVHTVHETSKQFCYVSIDALCCAQAATRFRARSLPLSLPRLGVDGLGTQPVLAKGSLLADGQGEDALGFGLGLKLSRGAASVLRVGR